ncbi:MAG: alpha-amylase family glycosyl hydrolase, partial [Polyangiaceae bacterium]|nr:alpha-amylase family glycosyl hydrolase [Polyangiaceae bacterium]
EDCAGQVGDYDCNQVLYGDFPGGLKDINTQWIEVRNAMVHAYAEWITKVDFDGFRIDTLKHVEHGFWVDFCQRIREHAAKLGKDKFLMFGESFGGDDRLNGSYTMENQLDSVFYFSQKYVLDNVFKNAGHTRELKDLFDRREANHGTQPQPGGAGQPPHKLLVGFLDNHDVARFLYEKKRNDNGIEALRTALVFLLTEDGIPCIYYGTEQEFEGGNDPNNREDLWITNFNTNNPTFKLIAELNRIRKDYEPLRRGDFVFSQWTDDSAGILAFERYTDDNKRVLVVINTHDSESKNTQVPFYNTETETDEVRYLKTGFGSGTVLVNVLTDDDPTDKVTVEQDGIVNLTLPPRGAKIFVPENQRK